MSENTIHAVATERAINSAACCEPSCCGGQANVTLTTDTSIHEAVRERYSSIAQNSASCCNSSCCTTDTADTALYEASLLEGLPSEVTNLSLGCGDPVTIAGLQAGETVLDLGSGGGIDCFLAARQVGETGYVIGVDMTDAMLEKANAAKARMGVGNVEFRKGQIEALPVAENSVDVIMSNCVINLSPDKRAVFAEAFRVLKPGGRVSISDIVTEGAFSAELRADAAKWAECVTGAIDAADYMAMMREVGFAEVQVIDKTSADDLIGRQAGMPRLYSARISGVKPAHSVYPSL
jgi:arsenite methyltransferase